MTWLSAAGEAADTVDGVGGEEEACEAVMSVSEWGRGSISAVSATGFSGDDEDSDADGVLSLVAPSVAGVLGTSARGVAGVVPGGAVCTAMKRPITIDATMRIRTPRCSQITLSSLIIHHSLELVSTHSIPRPGVPAGRQTPILARRRWMAKRA
jgi:hypothetical protein